MPAVLKQIDGMSVSDKMQIMEYLLKSIALAVNETVKQKAASRGDFSRFAGRWSVDEANAFKKATMRESSQLLGAASAYAKPSMRNRESGAFRRAMEAKHAAIR